MDIKSGNEFRTEKIIQKNGGESNLLFLRYSADFVSGGFGFRGLFVFSENGVVAGGE